MPTMRPRQELDPAAGPHGAWPKRAVGVRVPRTVAHIRADIATMDSVDRHCAVPSVTVGGSIEVNEGTSRLPSRVMPC